MVHIRFIGKLKTLKNSFSTKKPSINEEKSITSEKSDIIKPHENHSQPKIIAEYNETLYAKPLVGGTSDRKSEFIETSIDYLNQDKPKSEVEKAVDRILARKHKK